MAQRDRIQIQGELQLAIMKVMWRLEEATVDQVLHELPSAQRGAYTTIQTVLNRLAERGLLGRIRAGKAIKYSPEVKEDEYLSRSLSDTLQQASPQARQVALSRLMGELDSSELAEIEALAEEVKIRRDQGRG